MSKIQFNPRDTAWTQMQLVANGYTTLSSEDEVGLINAWMLVTEKHLGQSLDGDGKQVWRDIMRNAEYTRELETAITVQAYGRYRHPECGLLDAVAHLLSLMSQARYGLERYMNTSSIHALLMKANYSKVFRATSSAYMEDIQARKRENKEGNV